MGINGLNAELLETKDGKCKLFNENKSLNEVLMNRQEELESLQQTIDNNIKGHDEVLSKYKKENADIATELEAYKTECNELKSISSKAQSDMAKLQSINEEYSSNNATLHDNITKLEEEKQC